MRAIVTVLGKDRVGIMSLVCALLAQHNVNILDISQTILQGDFTMVMLVDAGVCDIPFAALAALLERAAVLAEWLRGLDYTALKKLLAGNDGIAELNFRRFQEMDLRRPGAPALLSYDGIQYQYMAPHLFTRPQFEYAETHLRILSGFYGVLRPFDGVLPYRLEMGARCSTPFCKSLYDFWGDSLYRTLTAGGEDTLLNLASAEYAKAVRPWVTPPVRWINVTFGEADGDKVVEKGVYVKMARGEMVRFLAERNAETPEEAQGFDRLGYRFSPAHSTAASYVFLREGRTN